MKTYPLIVDGQLITTGKMLEVHNPADESLVGVCPTADAALLDRAVAAARRALPAWSALPDAERVAKLNAIADLIEQHHAELATLITQEQGKPQNGIGANVEAGGAAAWTRVTAGLSLPVETIQDDATGKVTIERRPVGVVGSITPWNWPMLIATWHVMPALRAGCTVVAKPASCTPLSTLRMYELMNTVLPPGVVNIVAGSGEIGDRMARHPGINKIVFTGSTNTGRQVATGAISSFKRLTLELGGNDAGIILPGTTIDPILEKLFWGCFINAGQTCAALKRLYVHESQYEEVVRKLADYAAKVPVGNGLDPNTLIGPLTNKAQRDIVHSFVEDARAKGARVVSGGVLPEGAGFFYPLTVVAGCTDDMLLVREEQFGPAIPVISYQTVDEAIARANAVDVGLGGSVWGDDLDEATRQAVRLECGTTWVNQHGGLNPLACFGGVKASGIGTEFNVDGLKEYTTIQVVNIAR
ncbi:MAG: aldehyde dehydrogenase family protein [Gammaproteobacteria bacterium]|nr:aldehyde dehydrogenase family protein [Gammaproteobacteria bacterium]